MKDVGSLTDIDDFLKRQRDLYDEPVEKRSGGHWPRRRADDRSRACDIRYGVTRLRSAQNPNQGEINTRYWENVRVNPKHLH